MGPSVRIGKLFGVPVNLHFSWFFIFLFFIILIERHFDQRALTWSPEERWLVAIASTVLLFMSVLAHELSHSLVAERQGIPVKGITLFIFGGVSQLAREPHRPSTEFIVAVVGPLFSVALGLLFLGPAILLDGVNRHGSEIAWILVTMNIVLGIFNLLPCFPMDGGRVVRAVVWGITRNYWRATNLATRVSQALALGLIGTGATVVTLNNTYLFSGLWLVVLGVFLQMIAAASHRQSRMRENLKNRTAKDLMTTSYPLAPADIDLEHLVEAYLTPAGCDIAVLSSSGAAEGVITLQMMKQVTRRKWAETTSGSMMVPLDRIAEVRPDEPAYKVMELIEGQGIKHVLVTEGGAVLGVIARDNLRRHTTSHASTRR